MHNVLNIVDADHALKSAEHNLGSSSLELIQYLDNLGSSFHAHGQYSSAEECYKRALEIKRANKIEDVDVIVLEHKLGVLNRIQHRYTQAEEHYVSALRIAEKIYGKESIEVAERNNYLAGLYYACGLFELAERSLLKSIELYAAFDGTSSAAIGLCCLSLALIRRKAGAESEALELFERAKRMLMQEPSFRESVEGGLILLALQHFEEKNTEKTEILLRHYLVIGEQLWPYHPLVTESFYQLAEFLQSINNYEASEACYMRVLAKQKASLEANDPVLTDTLKRIAALHLSRGEKDKAISYMKQALGMA